MRLQRQFFSVPGHPTGRMCRVSTSKSFGTKTFAFCKVVFLCGLVPTTFAEIFVQETCAEYHTLAACQDEYRPHVTRGTKGFGVQERATEQLATHPVCPPHGSSDHQGSTGKPEGQFLMGPSSTCPSSPKGTPRNTLPILLQSYISSAKRGSTFSAGSWPRRLTSWPKC